MRPTLEQFARLRNKRARKQASGIEALSSGDHPALLSRWSNLAVHRYACVYRSVSRLLIQFCTMLASMLRRQHVGIFKALTDTKDVTVLVSALTEIQGILRSESIAIGPLPSLRTFAASNHGSSSPGPSSSKIRAIPFTVSPDGALQTFDHYHNDSLLNKRPSGGECLRCLVLACVGPAH